jgi:alpha-beta hydrolase superfamily lysophospholipase
LSREGRRALRRLAAVNATVAREAPEPETGAVGGEAGTFQWKHGQVFYRHAGAEDAPPVLFVHGIGAGARAFMWRRNFLPLARDFRVYAIDLLGFGYSDKPAANAPYSADLYVELISDFLREVVGRPGRRRRAHALGGLRRARRRRAARS